MMNEDRIMKNAFYIFHYSLLVRHLDRQSFCGGGSLGDGGLILHYNTPPLEVFRNYAHRVYLLFVIKSLFSGSKCHSGETSRFCYQVQLTHITVLY